jgi:hypothetical protein
MERLTYMCSASHSFKSTAPWSRGVSETRGLRHPTPPAPQAQAETNRHQLRLERLLRSGDYDAPSPLLDRGGLPLKRAFDRACPPLSTPLDKHHSN